MAHPNTPKATSPTNISIIDVDDQLSMIDLSYFKTFERTSVLVDVANINWTSRFHGRHVDWEQVIRVFKRAGPIDKAYYFVATTPVMSTVRQAELERLRDVGYTLYLKECTVRKSSSDRSPIKANVDVDLALTAVLDCDDSDHIVIMSGDGDYVPLVKRLQAMGKFVTVVTPMSRQNSTTSQALMREANHVVNLLEISGATTDSSLARPSPK